MYVYTAPVPFCFTELMIVFLMLIMTVQRRELASVYGAQRYVRVTIIIILLGPPLKTYRTWRLSCGFATMARHFGHDCHHGTAFWT